MYDVKKHALSKIINTGYKIKINYKTVNGKIVLYMNYRKMIDGVSKQQSKHLVTLTSTDKTEDLKRVNQAMIYRAEYEISMKTENAVFKRESEKIFLVDYILKHASRYQNKGTRDIFKTVIKHITDCLGNHITLCQVDKAFCNKVRDYFIKVMPKSSNHYYKKFKQVLYKAIDEEIISDLPFLRRLSIKNDIPVREFLTEEELLKIRNLDFENKDVQNAFIFSCYQGLRYVDLSHIEFSNIEGERLRFKQHKTGEDLIIKLHSVSLEIIEIQRKKNKVKVFENLSYAVWQEKVREMIKLAGITKRISGHCARHTFGTRVYRATKDIYVTSKLMGHKTVTATLIYARMVDEEKDNAIDKLK